MKKWIIGFTIVWCLLFLSYQHSASQMVLVWTEKGCNATYKPGETVKIHYKVDGSGWTRVSKQYPDTHEEEIFGWRYFPTGGEYVEIDRLGPECGTITYTVTFWEDVGAACPACLPCNALYPVVYVMEVGRNMCSIDVQCDMRASLFTDKGEYISGVDSEAKITLNITDVYENPIDVDSVVMDVNGEGVTAIKSSAGLYTASFVLSAREPGTYTVEAAIFKRNYPESTKTTTFGLITPVSVQLSTDRKVYIQNASATVRAEVRDISGRGVSGLHFDVSVSGVVLSFADLGGGIYEAQVDLSEVEQGSHTADIANMEGNIRVDSVRKADFTVSGPPVIEVELPDHLEVRSGARKDVSFLLKNTGNGDALSITVRVEAPSGVDVMGVSGYASVILPGGETTGVMSLQGREAGVYTVTATVSYLDAGGSAHTASGSSPVTVTSGLGLLLVAAVVGAAVVLGAGAYILKGRGGKEVAEEVSKKQKVAQNSQSSSTKAAEAATKGSTETAEAAKKDTGTKAAEAASKAGSKVTKGVRAGGGAVGGLVKEKEPKRCAKCKFENSPESTFCSQCGAEL